MVATAVAVATVVVTVVVAQEAAMVDHARVAMVAGGTGLVGREILAALLADSTYAAVHSVGRRKIDLKHPKLVQHIVDFANLHALPSVDDVFIALGTTIKVAGSQAAFKAIDFEAVVVLARAAYAQGATRLGVVSAMGADSNAAIFYNRVKGEMEEAVSSIGFGTVSLVRPSLLDGARTQLQQPSRLGERWMLSAMRRLTPLIPKDYRAVRAQDVAYALIASVKTARPGVQVLLSGALQNAAPQGVGA